MNRLDKYLFTDNEEWFFDNVMKTATDFAGIREEEIIDFEWDFDCNVCCISLANMRCDYIEYISIWYDPYADKFEIEFFDEVLFEPTLLPV